MSRLAFTLAKQFDEAVRAAGDNPDDGHLVVVDMIERMMCWCDIHEISFEEQLPLGRRLHKQRQEETNTES